MNQENPYTGLFVVFSLLLLAIDVVALGGVSLYNLGIDIFTPFANAVINSGLYSGEKYYMIRIIIVGCLVLASAGANNKSEAKYNLKSLILIAIIITVLFVFIYNIFRFGHNVLTFSAYSIGSVVLYLTLIMIFGQIIRSIKINVLDDRFGREGRRFEQETRLIENKYSVNIKTADGWINVINPFRATYVTGNPGSGKSFAVLYQAIIQHIKKGFSILVYDYKFPALTILTYNALKMHIKNYEIEPEFCVINFDNPKKSQRCNPLQPNLIVDSMDAVELSTAIMVAINRSWNEKEGEFFVESPINYVACLIWGLRSVEKGKYCSLPHLIELISRSYEDQFMFLASLNDSTIHNLAAPFVSAYDKGAVDQLEGQIASARLGLSKLTSPVVYWVMTSNWDFENDTNIDGIDLRINEPETPKILCIGNNPQREKVYSVCISLFNTKLLKLINVQGKNKTAIILDELTTMSFPKGTLDTIIATGRSNKIAVWLGFQDLTQLVRDFSEKNANAIINTIGNFFSGSVSGETAKRFSEGFGQIKVEKISKTISDNNISTTISEQMEIMIPQSEISNLSQGTFVGKIVDDFGQKIEMKTFYSEIQVDIKALEKLEEGELPDMTTFYNEDGSEMNINEIQLLLKENFIEIKDNIDIIIRTAEENKNGGNQEEFYLAAAKPFDEAREKNKGKNEILYQDKLNQEEKDRLEDEERAKTTQ